MWFNWVVGGQGGSPTNGYKWLDGQSPKCEASEMVRKIESCFWSWKKFDEPAGKKW